MRNILLSICLLTAYTTSAQKTIIKVLFIGNSYVFVNDLPGTLQKVAHSAGDSIYVDASAIGGYFLRDHLHNPATISKIKSMPWDYVVLQEQSQLPSFPPAQVDTGFYPYAHALDSIIHHNDSCTHTVFYMTWGKKYGDAGNCGSYSILCTFDGIQSRLRTSYLQAADTNKAIVAPVGMAWYHSWHADSSINLWQSDNSHPSLFGAYLSACTFYSTLLKKTCSKVTYVTSGITAKQATFLRNTASHTVMDSVSTWDIGVFDPHARFTFKPSGTNMTFANTSKNASHYLWLFGDSKTSTSANPTHIYSSKTAYTVKCIAYRDCMSDTLSQTLSWTGIDNLTKADFLFIIYPNPSQNSTTFEWSNTIGATQIEITDAMGRYIVTQRISGSKWIWEHSYLASGVYLVRMQLENGYVVAKCLVIE